MEKASVALIEIRIWDRARPGTIAATEKAARVLRDNGVRVEEVSFPASLGDSDSLKRLQQIIISADAQVAFFREYRVDKPDLDQEIQRLVENSANITRKEILQGLDTLASMRSIVDDLAAEYWAIHTQDISRPR